MIFESNGIVLPIYEFFTCLFHLILNGQVIDYGRKPHLDNKCMRYLFKLSMFGCFILEIRLLNLVL